MQKLRPGVRDALHRSQCDLESDLKSFGSGFRNSLRGRSGKHLSNEFNRLAHHVGETRSETRMFKRLNGSLQSGQVFCSHAFQVQFPTLLGGNAVMAVAPSSYTTIGPFGARVDVALRARVAIQIIKKCVFLNDSDARGAIACQERTRHTDQGGRRGEPGSSGATDGPLHIVLATPQKNGIGAWTIPVIFLRQA